MISAKLMIIIAMAFQIFGAFLLGLMTFRGLKINTSSNVFVNGKPVTNVTMSAGYLTIGKFGILFELIGILLSSFASLLQQG